MSRLIICCKSTFIFNGNSITFTYPIIFIINSYPSIIMRITLSIFKSSSIAYFVIFCCWSPTSSLITIIITINCYSYILTCSCCCSCSCCKCRIWQCTKYTKSCYSTAYYKCSNTTANTISRSSTLFSVTMGKF